MPIVWVPRNGPPDALICPVMLCEACGDRIHHPESSGSSVEDPDRSRRPGLASGWARYVDGDTKPAETRRESSPMFFLHKGQCDLRFNAYGDQFYRSEDGWSYQWEEIGQVVGQLVRNMARRFEDDPDLASGHVLYHPPARIVNLLPSEFETTPTWWVGNADR